MKANIKNTGVYYKVIISDEFDNDIVEFKKQFLLEEQAEKFIKSKPFQRLIKLVEKGGLV